MGLTKDKFKQDALANMENARQFWHNWRTETVDYYAFVSGKQWTDEDEAKLRQQKRPPITFNYSEKMIDAVVGAEVSNRNEVTYKPRQQDDFASAEMWSEAARWARQSCLEARPTTRR